LESGLNYQVKHIQPGCNFSYFYPMYIHQAT